MSFVSWGAMPVGSLLGGVLGTAFGLRPTLWIAGAAALAGSAWLFFSPFRTLRTIPAPAFETAGSNDAEIADRSPAD
jgi:hypothetical protein